MSTIKLNVVLCTGITGICQYILEIIGFVTSKIMRYDVDAAMETVKALLSKHEKDPKTEKMPCKGPLPPGYKSELERVDGCEK